jgi:hypothetical protein
MAYHTCTGDTRPRQIVWPWKRIPGRFSGDIRPGVGSDCHCNCIIGGRFFRPRRKCGAPRRKSPTLKAGVLVAMLGDYAAVLTRSVGVSRERLVSNEVQIVLENEFDLTLRPSTNQFRTNVTTGPSGTGARSSSGAAQSVLRNPMCGMTLTVESPHAPRPSGREFMSWPSTVRISVMRQTVGHDSGVAVRRDTRNGRRTRSYYRDSRTGLETEIAASAAGRQCFATFQATAPHLREREIQVAPCADA